MPPREPDFVFVPEPAADQLLSSLELSPTWHLERLVRRQPPGYEPELVVKVPRFLLAASAQARPQP